MRLEETLTAPEELVPTLVAVPHCRNLIMKKINYFKNNQTGFSLVELILYVAIMAFFVTTLVQFAWDIIYGKAKTQTQIDVNYNTRFAAQRITKLIRNATAINSLTTSSVSLSYLDATKNPTVILLQNNQVFIGQGTTGNCSSTNPCALTSPSLNVSSLNFFNLSAGNSKHIKFDLTVESNSSREEWNATRTYASGVELQSL